MKDAEKDESRRHRGIQYPEKNDRGYHERKRNLLKHILQRSERRSSHVLVPRVDVDDTADDAEDDDFGYCAGP